MKKVAAAVVVNPASANGKTGKQWPEMAAVMEQEGLSFVHTFTEQPDHATEITRSYLKEGYELIVSVGGDGTANEVVNGFFENEQLINKNASASFISTGTGRDLARTINIPADTKAAVRQIINSKPRKIDLGRVNFINNQGSEEDRFFINIAGLGLDGETACRVNRTSKALGGFVSFLWGTVVTLALYKNKNMAITVDGQLICDEPITIVVIGNGRYFGGGMFVAPHAEINDGLFDVIILRNLSKPNLLMNLPRVYGGTHLSHPRISSLRGTEVSITSTGEALLELDGEQIGQAPARFKLVPQALYIKA